MASDSSPQGSRHKKTKKSIPSSLGHNISNPQNESLIINEIKSFMQRMVDSMDEIKAILGKQKQAATTTAAAIPPAIATPSTATTSTFGLQSLSLDADQPAFSVATAVTSGPHPSFTTP